MNSLLGMKTFLSFLIPFLITFLIMPRLISYYSYKRIVHDIL